MGSHYWFLCSGIYWKLIFLWPSKCKLPRHNMGSCCCIHHDYCWFPKCAYVRLQLCEAWSNRKLIHRQTVLMVWVYSPNCRVYSDVLLYFQLLVHENCRRLNYFVSPDVGSKSSWWTINSFILYLHDSKFLDGSHEFLMHSLPYNWRRFQSFQKQDFALHNFLCVWNIYDYFKIPRAT